MGQPRRPQEESRIRGEPEPRRRQSTPAMFLASLRGLLTRALSEDRDQLALRVARGRDLEIP
jgi:hypothetical protein